MGKRDKSPKGKKSKKAQKVVVKHPKRVAYGATWRNPREKKNIDFDVDLAPPATGTADIWSTPILINGVAQGVGAGAYVGRSLMLKSFHFRYVCRFVDGGTGGTPSTVQVRLVFVYDRSVERNSAGTLAVPTIPEIFATSEFGTFNNLGQSSRFCVLYDKVKAITPVAQDEVVSNSTAFWKGNIKLNHLMQFVGTTNLIASIEKGAIYAMVAQDGTLTNQEISQGRLWTRFRFIDS